MVEAASKGILFPEEVVALTLQKEGMSFDSALELAGKIMRALADYSKGLPLTSGIPAVIFDDEVPDWVEIIEVEEEG